MNPSKDKRKKKVCHCRIRGIVKIWKVKDNLNYALTYEQKAGYWRRFKYCPLCGKELI